MEFQKEWISNQLDASAIQWAEKKGRDYASILTTSQIRKFFGALRGLELKADENQQQLLLLKPKLAYAIARIVNSAKDIRDKKGELIIKKDEVIKRLKDFYEDIGKALENINDKQSFNNFIGLFEAFVAYHKFHGGKEINS
jgi:CRISPR-associated protein Csm2